MEPIIIFLIISALSYFFKDKSGDKEEEAKPFMPQKQKTTKASNTPSEPSERRNREVAHPGESLQDISRQLFEQLKQQQMPEEVKAPVEEHKTDLQKAYERRVQLENEERRNAQRVVQEARQTRRGREEKGLAVYDDVWTKEIKDLKQEDLLPKTDTDLIKGVIFAEIMSPPKSMRKKV